LLAEATPAAAVLAGPSAGARSAPEAMRLALERLTSFRQLFGEGRFQEAGAVLEVVFQLLRQQVGSGAGP
jgi:hypothetical protein